jgi:hypothetical protein
MKLKCGDVRPLGLRIYKYNDIFKKLNIFYLFSTISPILSKSEDILPIITDDSVGS